MHNTIETVHVVFKTHLDIGFTDLAQHVINRYMDEYIPKAIRLAEEMVHPDGKHTDFVWTTGSWLIHQYLHTKSGADRDRLCEAIQRGHITWHGLPFTTHTELMDVELFNYGLSLAKELDQQFGKRTIAAKMTDVPGHTISVVPPLAQGGIRYLHLGVNPVCKVPEVPKLFVWRHANGSEVIVNYSDTYGEIVQYPGLRDALVFAHTGDNCGPPQASEIRTIFDDLRKKYPGARIQASTLDAFASELWKVKEQLPIVEEEIGDTWIHGVGTDPAKVAGFRALLRLRNEWLASDPDFRDSRDYRMLSQQLLLTAEHTWGLDLKKYLADYRHYARRDFHEALKRDQVTADAIPEKYAYIGAFAMNEYDELSKNLFHESWSERTYSFFASSWQEQREYITQAVASLQAGRRRQAEQTLQDLAPKPPESNFGEMMKPGEPYKLGRYMVEFDYSGAICRLDELEGKAWISQGKLGQFVYESFGKDNYDRWFSTYLEHLDEHYHWADSDYGKPGMEFAQPMPKHNTYNGQLQSIQHRRHHDADEVQIVLRMPDFAVQELGAPRQVVIRYRFDRTESLIDIDLSWFDKAANRLPEAAWLILSPDTGNPSRWKLHKMGHWISPLDIVGNGNRNLHAVEQVVSYEGADGAFRIDTLDCPLVSPGGKGLLHLDNRLPALERGMWFNLHNNVWGTNFPMWYGDDARFRFRLTTRSY